MAVRQVSDKGFQVTPLLTSRDSLAWNELETIDLLDTARLNPLVGEKPG
ncbi:MAG: hypothetical protein V8R91_12110 [Butyricimonas faecihominis]